MKNIINKLYNSHLEENAYPFGIPDKDNTQKEWELYNFLCENLSAEYRENFLNYVNLRGIRQTEELKVAFEYGFKNAIQLILQSIKE